MDPRSAIGKPLPAPLAFDQGDEMDTIWQLAPLWPHEEPGPSLVKQYWSESMARFQHYENHFLSRRGTLSLVDKSVSLWLFHSWCLTHLRKLSNQLISVLTATMSDSEEPLVIHHVLWTRGLQSANHSLLHWRLTKETRWTRFDSWHPCGHTKSQGPVS